MAIFYHSYLSPYARRVLIVFAEKGLSPERKKVTYAREFDELTNLNPCLLLPVYVEEAMHLWGSNLIIEYLMSKYPNRKDSPDPPFADAMTRLEYHWEDSKVLATLETLTDTVMNLRQMKMSGLEPHDVVYLKRQRDRIDLILDWLETRATPEGFAPGLFSMCDLNLICALGNIDNRKSFEWRGRPALEAIVARYKDRPSVSSTSAE